MGWFDGEAGHSAGRQRGLVAARRWPLVFALLLVGALLTFGMFPNTFVSPSAVQAKPASRTGRTDSTGTLTIAVPVPANNVAQGPVGTNITVIGSNLTPSTTYQLGYATQDTGCTAGYKQLAGVTIATDGNGQGSATFAWPSTIASVGTSYYLCAQDPAANQTQSQEVFTVLSAQRPAFNVKPVAGATPGAGTPTIPPTGYYPGSTLELDGSNFLPAGVQLQVYLSTKQITQPADLANATLLSTVDGQSIMTSNDGHATAMVQIPTATHTGIYYLYLVSADSQANALPSLMAVRKINVTTAPTPVPTATTVPPTATPASVTPTAGSSQFGTKRLLAVIGLGGLSLILFIVGVILLASAAAMPRANPRV